MSRRPAHTAGILAALLPIVLLLPGTAFAGGRPQGAGHARQPHWQVVITAPAVMSPSGIAIDLRGNPKQSKWAYVAGAATQRIVKFGTNGTVLGSWQYGDAPNAGTPAAVAVGGSGNVFVANPAAGTLTKFSPSGKFVSRWDSLQEPRGVTVDRTGNVFVAEYGAQRLTKFSPSGQVLMHWTTKELYSPGGSTNPTGVAIAPNGYVYASTICVAGTSCGVGLDLAPKGDLIDGLYEFSAYGARQGHLLEIWFGLGYKPNGAPDQPPYKEGEPFAGIDAIGSDQKGNLYVAGLLWARGGNPARGVLAYSNVGYKWGRWNLPSQSPAHGIAVDAQGTIYVSQDGHVLVMRHA
jgi:hypothetical protein